MREIVKNIRITIIIIMCILLIGYESIKHISSYCSANAECEYHFIHHFMQQSSYHARCCIELKFANYFACKIARILILNIKSELSHARTLNANNDKS